MGVVQGSTAVELAIHRQRGRVEGQVGRGRVVTLADVEPEQVRWLWRNRLAYGKLNGIVGNGGLGKSTVTLDLAARVSGGLPMPDGASRSKPADVVILSAEDGIADTIAPRFQAAGGDSTRVHVLAAVEAEDGFDSLPMLPDDLDVVAQVIRKSEAKLLIVDPWSAFLNSDINSWRDADVRRALAPLAEVADATGVCALLVAHLNKSSSQSPLHRIVGSVAMGAAMRQVVLVGPDPDDQDARVFAQLKANLGPRPDALGYRLESAQEYGVARVQWTGESRHSIADLLGQGTGKVGETATERASRMLRVLLEDGPRPAEEVRQEVVELADVADRTVDRARREAGIQSDRLGGSAGSWYWHLPGDWPPPTTEEGVLI